MSRTGKLPIEIPSSVKVELSDGVVSTSSSKGKLELRLTSDVVVLHEDSAIVVKPANDSGKARAMWGTTRSNIANMVEGVSNGYSITLEIKGVGYRAQLKGKVLNLALGYSHDIKFAIPEGIEVKCPKNDILEISGVDKQNVGQIAADIRSLRKPEPYKGKGIRYKGEYVRAKEGKKK